MVKTKAIKDFEEHGIIHPNKAGEVAEYLAQNNTEEDNEDENT